VPLVAFLFDHPFTGLAIQYGAGPSNDLIGGIPREPFECLIDHEYGTVHSHQHQSIVHGVDNLLPVAVNFFFVHITCPANFTNGLPLAGGSRHRLQSIKLFKHLFKRLNGF
jgi:hypothetical protein